jgi:hypothetical protein
MCAANVNRVSRLGGGSQGGGTPFRRGFQGVSP